jgi:AcrR family transcriptional regulator
VFSQTALTDIADKLGFSRTALYYYVEDRADLLFQVYRQSSEVLARHLGEAVRAGKPVLQTVADFVSRTLAPDAPEVAALSEIGLLGKAERETVLAIQEGIVARLASLLERGAKAGEVRFCDFTIAAHSILSIIGWVPLGARWAAQPAADRRHVIDVVNDLIANGWLVDRKKRVDPAPIDLSPLLATTGDVFDHGKIFAAKREKILATASRLFNQRGVYTTSLDDIAAALGATKRTLYHHVGDKQALISACYARADRIYWFIHDAAAARNVSVFESMVIRLRASAMAQLQDEIEPFRVAGAFGALSTAEQIATARRSADLVREHVELFRNGQKEGSVRDINIETLMQILPGGGAWLSRAEKVADARQRERIAEETSNILMLGIHAI